MIARFRIASAAAVVACSCSAVAHAQWTSLAGVGQPIDAGGTELTLSALGLPVINDAGQVAFTGTTDTGDGVVMRWDPMAGFSLLARSGDAAPVLTSLGGGFDGTLTGVLSDIPALNDAGDVAFRASLSTGAGLDEGLFVYRDNTLHAYARSGQADTADHNGTLGSFGKPVLDGSGHVWASATFRDAIPFNQGKGDPSSAVLRFHPDGAYDRVVRGDRVAPGGFVDGDGQPAVHLGGELFTVTAGGHHVVFGKDSAGNTAAYDGLGDDLRLRARVGQSLANAPGTITALDSALATDTGAVVLSGEVGGRRAVMRAKADATGVDLIAEGYDGATGPGVYSSIGPVVADPTGRAIFPAVLPDGRTAIIRAGGAVPEDHQMLAVEGKTFFSYFFGAFPYLVYPA